MNGKRIGLASHRIEGLYGVLDPAVVTAGAKDVEEALETAISEAIAGGCRIVQYRDKRSSPRTLFTRTRRLAGICGKAGALFLVNDRLDIALMAEVDGCHLGQDDLPIPEARKLVPPDFILGSSTHDVVEARRAQREGADYVGVGAIFRTMTKNDARDPQGPTLIAAVAEAVSLPAIAISGNTRRNVREVIRAGASGFAVISDLFGGPDIRERAKEFLRIWDEETGRR